MDFNDALEQAKAFSLNNLQYIEEDIYLIRDLQGRIRILLKKEKAAKAVAVQNLAQDIAGALDFYTYPEQEIVIYREKLKHHLQTLNDQTARKIASNGTYSVYLHDRLLIGGEWDASFAQASAAPKRFTLFSMKGGVGRSTTALVLARHLAAQGKRVLIFDLDLESPGISSSLLGNELPKYGVVDWFVEDAVGNPAPIIADLQKASPLQEDLPGSITVVPAYGTETGDYLPKLGRSYLERNAQGYKPWTDRLKELVQANETHYQAINGQPPDVVLYDSRTGLHDSSAALVLAMGANTLMFAVNTEQTWRAYRFLFSHWQNHPNIQDFYDKLWIIGALIPETENVAYIEGLRDSSYTLFDETIYRSPAVTGHPQFVPTNRESEYANHFPREIMWNRGMMALDPLSRWPERAVPIAYDEFLNWFDQKFFGNASGDQDP
jgi:MinD-like ATPase involved in chromosome partitioning or flagellar assembly